MKSTTIKEITDISAAAFSVTLTEEDVGKGTAEGLNPLPGKGEDNSAATVNLWVENTEKDAYLLICPIDGKSMKLSERVANNKPTLVNKLLDVIPDSEEVVMVYSACHSLTIKAEKLESALNFGQSEYHFYKGYHLFYRITGAALKDIFGDLSNFVPFKDAVLRVGFVEEGMSFEIYLDLDNIDELGENIKFQQLVVGLLSPYGEVNDNQIQLYLAASVKAFSEAKNPNADFYANITLEGARPVGFRFGIDIDINTNAGINKLGSLLPKSGEWSVPDDFPKPNVILKQFGGYFSLKEGNIGLLSLSGQLTADFNNWSPLQEGDDKISKLFAVNKVGLNFQWQKNMSVIWGVEGSITLGTYELAASYLHPHRVISAKIAPTNTSSGSIAGLLKEDLGVPAAASDAIAEVLTSVDLSVYAELRDGELTFNIRNYRPWKVFKSGLEILDLDIRIFMVKQNNSYKFSEAHLYAVMTLPIGSDNGEKREPVDVYIEAEYNRPDEKWLFTGETGLGQNIAVGEAISALIAKIGDKNPKEVLPEAVSSLAVRNIQVNFDSAGNADFVCETVMEIDGREVNFWVHLKRENGTLFLSGSVFVNGIQLAVAFSSDEEAKDILGSLTVPIKTNTKDIIADLAPELKDSIPINVEVELRGFLIGMRLEKGEKAQKEYLFRLSFALDFDLSGFPLIGEMLKHIRFTDGQLIAANQDRQNKDIDAVNNLLGLIKPNAPAPIEKPQQANATVAVAKGISLSGTFQLTDDLGFPLFLNFGGKKESAALPPPGEKPAKRPSTPGKPDTAAQKAPPVPAKPDQRSQSKIDKVIGAVRIKKVAFIFDKGQIGLKITGGLALATFEFELMGLQVTVPQEVLNDPTQVSKIRFDLEGFGVKIQKGTLSVAGAFLRKHYEEETVDNKVIPAYDEYSGIVQVNIKPFNLVGLGSYAKYNGEHSLFLFVALGFPIPVHPSLLIQGMALGFGVHRDFVAPELDAVLTYPLIQMSVTPPPPMDIEAMVASMHDYFPPMVGQYFVVAGIKFRAFGLVDTIAMLAVKFGRSFEINLIGISSILLPATFIELAWMARFVPDEGYLYIGGVLTSRSYLLIPQVQLTGGFGVAVWAAGSHAGDFVVSVGGYHPKYKIPEHYPNHIPRLGISFELDALVVKGGIYFAVTPECLMMGGFLEASLKKDRLSAYLKMHLDVLINFDPFHYDLMIGVDAGVKVDIPAVLCTIHINVHLHLDVHIFGPEFSGTASVDVGPKTFKVAFGAGSSAMPLPVSWEDFGKKFLNIKEDAEPKTGPVSMSVTEGLINKVGNTYIIDPKKVVIEAKSLLPITEKTGGIADYGSRESSVGIAPMNVCGGGFKSKVKISGADSFDKTFIKDNVAKGIWGGNGLQKPDIGKSDSGLVKDVRTGVRLVPKPEKEAPPTKSVSKEKFKYNIDDFTMYDQLVDYQFTGSLEGTDFKKPTDNFFAFTGISDEQLKKVKTEDLSENEFLNFALA